MLNILNNILSYNLYGNSGFAYLVALFALIVSYFALRIIRKIVIVRLQVLSKISKTKLDDLLVDAIANIKSFTYFIVSFYIASQFLDLSAAFEKGAKFMLLLVLIYEGINIIQKIVGYFIFKASQKNAKGEDVSQAKASAKTLNVFIGIILWTIGVLMLLSNLDVNITSLIAGLGIGGIAVALAMQNILSDIFSSFSILIDKPFQVGDFIVIGSDTGVVEKIGIKTTRLKTLGGQMLIVSNQELTTARVENYYDIKRRRALFTLKVVYESSRKMLESIPFIVADVVKKIPNAELDRCHFKTYGDFSLDFEVSIYINEPGYNDYMDALQDINLDIFSRFKEAGIEFAYRTQVEYHK